MKMNTPAYPYPPAPQTAKDIFEGLPEGTRAQLIENMIVMEPAPAFLHQDISAQLAVAIYNFVKQRGLGKLLYAPINVYLDDENAFQPDILYISRERLSIIKKNGIYGAPDLIVEIISPATSQFDWHDKKRMYERNAVKEYWLVNPGSGMVQGYKLVKKAFQALPPAKGALSSVLLGAKFEFNNKPPLTCTS